MLMPSSSSGHRLPMEKPSQNNEQQQQQQPPLKCPRCDSSNTKFCYYNNYSLSQPRHFCKACKRYWTRGGTLRNVPVGGGCRKNKRVKRPSSAGATAVSAATPPEHHQLASARSSVDISGGRSTSHVNPLFFDMGGISYPRMHAAVDLHPHLTGSLGIGLSSPGFMPGEHGCGDNNNYIRELVSSAPVLSGGYSPDGIRCINTGMITPILGSASPFTTSMSTTVPSMASLLSSTIQHQKFFGTDLKDTHASAEFKGFSNFQDSRDADNELAAKEVKAEGLNMPGWSFSYQNQMELPNPLPHYWNIPSNIGTWHDPGNNGSSVPSL